MGDLWKSYDCLQNEGYQHLTVNHSQTFDDPDTVAHTPKKLKNWQNQERGTNKFIEQSSLIADVKIHRPRTYKNKRGEKGV